MGKGIDLHEYCPETLAGIFLVITLIITLTAKNSFAGYVGVAIVAFYSGGIYVLYRDNEPFWPIILICFGAVIGILVGSSFGRRFFVLLWYLLVLLLSIYAFEQNWVQRFKRRNWIK